MNVKLTISLPDKAIAGMQISSEEKCALAVRPGDCIIINNEVYAVQVASLSRGRSRKILIVAYNNTNSKAELIYKHTDVVQVCTQNGSKNTVTTVTLFPCYN